MMKVGPFIPRGHLFMRRLCLLFAEQKQSLYSIIHFCHQSSFEMLEVAEVYCLDCTQHPHYLIYAAVYDTGSASFPQNLGLKLIQSNNYRTKWNLVYSYSGHILGNAKFKLLTILMSMQLS